ncbi:hypothetical protein G7Y41_09045 [Schaalia sp. ZJ405]|uniref:hypothetical protein n=1 Tax=Schaalia sp. ZJ405 TaxID=2709403 RepID=UPI0013ED2D93|nr:hypothetical protein [Schaalia sp. ZJ405]QPK81167.1 hypothetical protein G7Y41_09045 [Schaalia sp. ZJ405]
MNSTILTHISRGTIAGSTALSLMFASVGVASASASIAEEGHPIVAKSAETFPTPSPADIQLYGTSDPETVYLLNQISEGFKEQGEKGFYQELVVSNPSPGEITPQSWSTFASCVGNGLAASFGIDILKRAFNHEVRNALKSRQWKVASSIIFRNLNKYLGKKAAQIIIKKIAAKVLPGGLPGQIAWLVAKCGVKEIW